MRAHKWELPTGLELEMLGEDWGATAGQEQVVVTLEDITVAPPSSTTAWAAAGPRQEIERAGQ